MRTQSNIPRPQLNPIPNRPTAPAQPANQAQTAQRTPTHVRMPLPAGVRPGSDQMQAKSWMDSPQFSPAQQQNLKGNADHLRQKHVEARDNFRNHPTVENEIKLYEASEKLSTFNEKGFRGLGQTPGTYNHFTDGLNARHKVLENRRQLRDDVKTSNAPDNVKRGAKNDYNLAKTHLKTYQSQNSDKLNQEKTIRQQTAHIQEPAPPAPRPVTPDAPLLGPHLLPDNFPPLSLDHPKPTSSSSHFNGFHASDFPPGVRPSRNDHDNFRSNSEAPVLPRHQELSRLKDLHGARKGEYYGMKPDGTVDPSLREKARADYKNAKMDVDNFRSTQKAALKEEAAQQRAFDKLKKEFGGTASFDGLPPAQSPFDTRPTAAPVAPGTPTIPIGKDGFKELSRLPGFNPGGPGGFSPDYPAFTTRSLDGNTHLHTGPEALRDLPPSMRGEPMKMQSDARGNVFQSSPLPPGGNGGRPATNQPDPGRST